MSAVGADSITLPPDVITCYVNAGGNNDIQPCASDEICSNMTLYINGVPQDHVIYDCIDRDTCKQVFDGSENGCQPPPEDHTQGQTHSVCCCDWDNCNLPNSTVTTGPPTPPSGQTFPPPVLCWIGKNSTSGRWDYCEPWEECYSNVFIISNDYGCKTRDYCVNKTKDHCGTLLTECCCSSDGCNNRDHFQVTTNTATTQKSDISPHTTTALPSSTTKKIATTTGSPTTQVSAITTSMAPTTILHSISCYENIGSSNGTVICIADDICGNITHYIDGVPQDHVIYECLDRESCRQVFGDSEVGCQPPPDEHSQGLAQSICCCDTDECNTPGTFATTIAPPTPPSGQTFPPPVLCWIGSNSTIGEWVYCEAWEECYTGLYLLANKYGCKERDYCANITKDHCGSDNALLQECCCGTDGCNNQKKFQGTTSSAATIGQSTVVTTIPIFTTKLTLVTTTRAPSTNPFHPLNCYENIGTSNGTVMCIADDICGNITNYIDGVAQDHVIYECIDRESCRQMLNGSDIGCQAPPDEHFNGQRICCCDMDECNTPGTFVTTIAPPTPPSGQTFPPPVLCWIGSNATIGEWVYCEAWEECYTGLYLLANKYGCKERDYCANITKDHCGLDNAPLQECCCGTDGCNNQKKFQGTTSSAATTGHATSTPPPQPLICYDNRNGPVDYGICDLGQICINQTKYAYGYPLWNSTQYACVDPADCPTLIDQCSPEPLANNATGVQTCCCDFDGCNYGNGTHWNPPTTVPTLPTDQTEGPGTDCWEGRNQTSGRWIKCPAWEECYAAIDFNEFGCHSIAYCRANGIERTSCGALQSQKHPCCCNSTYCNNPLHPPTTPRPTTPPPTIYCFDGNSSENATLKRCNPGQLCYNETDWLAIGNPTYKFNCADRSTCDKAHALNKCANTSIIIGGNEKCCCDTDGCNIPSKPFSEGPVTTIPTTLAPTTASTATTGLPTPPSGQTFPPPVTCWYGSSQTDGEWKQCEPWEECFTSLYVAHDFYGCQSRDYCSNHGIEMSYCDRHDALLQECCCSTDGCNNLINSTFPPTTPGPTTISTAKKPLICYDNRDGPVDYDVCDVDQICMNQTDYWYGYPQWNATRYSCVQPNTCYNLGVGDNQCSDDPLADVANATKTCCCDVDGCNYANGTHWMPKTTTAQAQGPGTDCWQGTSPTDGQWIKCPDWEECYAAIDFNDFGCHSMEYCFKNGLEKPMCDAVGSGGHPCCCNSTFCNNPSHPPTTPKPPPPPLHCWSGSSIEHVTLQQCNPGQMCFNETDWLISQNPSYKFSCADKRTCDKANADNKCANISLIFYDNVQCCCQSDGCNFPKHPLPTTTLPPTTRPPPTTQLPIETTQAPTITSQKPAPSTTVPGRSTAPSVGTTGATTTNNTSGTASSGSTRSPGPGKTTLPVSNPGQETTTIRVIGTSTTQGSSELRISFTLISSMLMLGLLEF